MPKCVGEAHDASPPSRSPQFPKKIHSCSASGCTLCLEVHLQLSSVNLAPNFFLRPAGWVNVHLVHPLATPMLLTRFGKQIWARCPTYVRRVFNDCCLPLHHQTLGRYTNAIVVIIIIFYLFLKSTWQRAGSATYMPHSSKNMHIKVIHTNKDTTLKLNTTKIKEASNSIWYILLLLRQFAYTVSVRTFDITEDV